MYIGPLLLNFPVYIFSPILLFYFISSRRCTSFFFPLFSFNYVLFHYTFRSFCMFTLPLTPRRVVRLDMREDPAFGCAVYWRFSWSFRSLAAHSLVSFRDHAYNWRCASSTWVWSSYRGVGEMIVPLARSWWVKVELALVKYGLAVYSMLGRGRLWETTWRYFSQRSQYQWGRWILWLTRCCRHFASW